MKLEDVNIKPGTRVRAIWTDGDETRGIFLASERGYIIIENSGVQQACLPSHLKNIEIIK